MKPEEAIKTLDMMLNEFCNEDSWSQEYKDAVDMAIKALKAQLSNTSEIPNGSDPISRQGAITAIIGLPTWYYDSDRHYGDPQPPMEALLDPEDVVNAIENLPSAQPEQDREFMKLTVRNSNGRPYYSIIYLEFDDNGIGNDFEGYSSYSLDVISDYLKKYFMPSAEPEQHWIPCSERLPEPRIDVWCNSDMGQIVGYYEENVETWYGRDYLELMVTAWMPLPEPYKDTQ